MEYSLHMGDLVTIFLEAADGFQLFFPVILLLLSCQLSRLYQGFAVFAVKDLRIPPLSFKAFV